MDKYDIVLDLIKHPAKYAPERIAEILSNPETREIYNLLCKTSSTFASKDVEVDVDAEWQEFSTIHKKPKSRFLWSGSRAASITAIAFTSLAAIACSIMVAVKTFEQKIQPNEVAATSDTVSELSTSQPISKDSTEVIEEVALPSNPVLFVDASLEEILSRIAEVHAAIVEYKNPETAQLHLYYKFDANISLKETVEQLNSFEQINIRIDGKKIIVN